MFVADGSDSNHGGDLGGDVFEDIKGPPRVGHRYYDAVDALVHEVRHGVLNGLRRHFAQGCDADEIARLPRRLLDSEERVRWPVLRHFAAEYANGLGSPCYQASCGGVPTVPPQLCDGLLHALAGLGAHIGVVVQHPGDGLVGDTCHSGNVLHDGRPGRCGFFSAHPVTIEHPRRRSAFGHLGSVMAVPRQEFGTLDDISANNLCSLEWPFRQAPCQNACSLPGRAVCHVFSWFGGDEHRHTEGCSRDLLDRNRLRTPPPTRMMRWAETPCSCKAASPSASEHNTPSTAARAMLAGV